MSSRAERQAGAVWLMVHGLMAANDGAELTPTKKALARLKPFVTLEIDRAVQRIQAKLAQFTRELPRNDNDELTEEGLASYLHMLTALVGDQWAQCPARPALRKRGWRRLNNALIDLLTGLSEPGDGELGVEVGCRWADRVKEILRQ